ncbi:uncharacterized mitochondrial protein AtMg00810-like [Solanum tuberosum]|uniref:uncharacterized mitochondrial protein AtMg00810-like n=1 Tax=Solanum tuberosum TaxID=4113 RepID=UPI00073A44D5|nr:PREDICTED: uncharacterized mitochondrial protein AtMg00810-like [Solanum tuberosum]
MTLPPSLAVDSPRIVCRLKKSLYGLKQASRQWYEKLVSSLCSKGYIHLDSDYSLFYKRKGASLVFVAIYVDDVILTGTDLEEINSLKSFLHDQFKIKDLGRLHYFLGLEILYRPDGVLISQRKFTTDLLKEFDSFDCKVAASPLDCTEKLKATDGKLLSDPTYYRKLIGKPNFLTNTRMDIAYSVQHLSQFMQTPREPHLKAGYHVLRYLRQDPTIGIFISNKPDLTVSAYCDSDWAACPDSRKSVSGYLVLMGYSPISWKSKKQATVSLSSAAVEYRAVRLVVGELVFCDSQAAVHIAKNLVFHERTKHIEIDCHFVRDKLQQGLITLHHISTDSQLADIFTKALTGVKHTTLLTKLSVVVVVVVGLGLLTLLQGHVEVVVVGNDDGNEGVRDATIVQWTCGVGVVLVVVGILIVLFGNP